MSELNIDIPFFVQESNFPYIRFVITFDRLNGTEKEITTKWQGAKSKEDMDHDIWQTIEPKFKYNKEERIIY